jgi:hypothetical protein
MSEVHDHLPERSDISKTITGSLDRQKLWESIGKPISPQYMTEADMNQHYRGRFSCINKFVLLEAQHALKFIGCPSCVKEKSHGEITVTRFHILVQDDPMTTFKALARCFCWNCAFEEYWPLSYDPRPQAAFAGEKNDEEYVKKTFAPQQPSRLLGGPLNRGLGNALGAMGQQSRGIGLNPLGAATRDEYEALQNMYRQAIKKHPPLAGDATDEVRQSIMQKIRDAMSGR